MSSHGRIPILTDKRVYSTSINCTAVHTKQNVGPTVLTLVCEWKLGTEVTEEKPSLLLDEKNNDVFSIFAVWWYCISLPMNTRFSAYDYFTLSFFEKLKKLSGWFYHYEGTLPEPGIKANAQAVFSNFSYDREVAGYVECLNSTRS